MDKLTSSIFRKTTLSQEDFELLLKQILEEKSLEALEKLTDNIYESGYDDAEYQSNLYNY